MNPKEVFHNTAYLVQLPYIDASKVRARHVRVRGPRLGYNRAGRYSYCDQSHFGNCAFRNVAT